MLKDAEIKRIQATGSEFQKADSRGLVLIVCVFRFKTATHSRRMLPLIPVNVATPGGDVLAIFDRDN